MAYQRKAKLKLVRPVTYSEENLNRLKTLTGDAFQLTFSTHHSELITEVNCAFLAILSGLKPFSNNPHQPAQEY